jgi:hypothetical protein
LNYANLDFKKISIKKFVTKIIHKYISTIEKILIVQKSLSQLSRPLGLLFNFFFNVLALRARSILPSDILEFLDRAFTQKGLKENVLGRKKRNYPKRSAIIKVNRATGEYSYPGESKEKVARTLSIKVFFSI